VLFALSQYFAILPAVDTAIHDNIMVSERNPMENIIIVGIDERSINEIGSWPWPRYFVAEAINQLTEMGAASIGAAILYTTTGAIPEYDEILVNAAQATDRLVLGGTGVFSPLQSYTGLLEIDYYALPFRELARHSTVGFLDVLQDEDGVMRRSLTALRFGDITVHSFPFEVYRTFRQSMGQPALTIGDIPLDNYGQFPIRYVGRPHSFTSVSLWGVINGEYPASLFRDAIVLIGPFAHGIGEGSFTTPLERSVDTFGVELYANIIQNLLEGVFLTDAPWWVNLAVLAICAVIIILLFKWLKPIAAMVATVILIAALLLGARLAYDQLHVILKVGDIIIFLFVCYLANLIFSILAAQNDKQHIKDLFGRFVAPEVVEKIVSGDVKIQLGGVVKEITALFVDIRGFTAFSENNPPEKVVGMVNRYLELTSSAVQKHNGTIDKFIGDATMALYNAPNDIANHALCAVKSAWVMKLGATALKDEIFERYGVDLQFGIGINTGDAVVGNMGSDFRMDYTAIGDTINTAARIESIAEKGQIIISEATYLQVKDHVEVKELGMFNFKNKSVGVLLYSVDNVLGGGN